MSSSTDITCAARRLGRQKTWATLGLVSTLLLAGCSETGGLNLKEAFQSNESGEEVVARASADTTLVEREVEAPEVFQAIEEGLWDGRPSLGGIWVAHPDVTDPERVMIRNASNGKFVVGALFRRERETPGPDFQASSEAAAALGMLAGAPTQLEVVALRKEAVPIAAPEIAAPTEADTLEEAPTIETASLDPLAGAAAAIEAAAGTEVAATASAASVETEELLLNEAAIITEEEAQSDPAAGLEKPFVQIGIFSDEENANRTADVLRGMGMVPTTRSFNRDGKPFWRLVVGPAETAQDRNQLLAQIKREGYRDAYPVTN